MIIDTISLIREVMTKSKMTQLRLADALGFKSQSGIANKLRSQDIKFDTVVSMLNACGYTVEIKNPTGEVEYSFKPEVTSDEKDC